MSHAGPVIGGIGRVVGPEPTLSLQSAVAASLPPEPNGHGENDPAVMRQAPEIVQCSWVIPGAVEFGSKVSEIRRNGGRHKPPHEKRGTGDDNAGVFFSRLAHSRSSARISLTNRPGVPSLNGKLDSVRTRENLPGRGVKTIALYMAPKSIAILPWTGQPGQFHYGGHLAYS